MDTWLMLRGHVGNDWNPAAMASTDMWCVLWRKVTEIAGVRGVVACLNEVGDGVAYYSSAGRTFEVCGWNINEMIDGAHDAGMVFHRGGFAEFDTICKYSSGRCLYYGAGVRTEPAHPELYRRVLRERDWMKPAIDEQFRPMPAAEKRYDICYIANAAQERIKGISWVYDTVPRNLSVLHLCRGTPRRPWPANVIVMECPREAMPHWINQCRIGIVPYWGGYDSAPRVLPEMQACGLPVVVASDVRFGGLLCGSIASKDGFWPTVGRMLACVDKPADVREWYMRYGSMDLAARTLHDIITQDVLCL